MDLSVATRFSLGADAALEKFDHRDLTEMKCFSTCPRGIDLVCFSVMHLLAGIYPDVKVNGKGMVKDLSWPGARKMMTNSKNLLNSLKDYKLQIDAGNVLAVNMEKARAIKDDMGESFTYNAMISKSRAAAGLCEFVTNIISYYDAVTCIDAKTDTTGAAKAMQLEDLRAPLGPTLIPKTEDRGITLLQFQRLLQYIANNCCAQGWTSCKVDSRDQELDPDTINLYDVVFWVIKPATQADECSYVELVAEGPQLPKWFVSHWWGEAVMLFVQCLRQHHKDRALPDDAAYWVCAYANNQWALEGDVCTDPAESSFRRAMDQVEGTVTILDVKITTYTRIWCLYEVFVSLIASHKVGPQYLYDIYTTIPSVRGDPVCSSAVGLTDGLVAADHGRVFCKTNREQHFPLELALHALDFDLTAAQASVEADRRHILNSIAGVDGLDAQPPASHEKYTYVNRLVRGRFALGLLRMAMEVSCRDLDKLCDAVRESCLERMDLSLDGCRIAVAEPLARAVPASLLNLELIFNSANLTDTGLQTFAPAIARAKELRRLVLEMCESGVGAEGLAALGAALRVPQHLSNLTLGLSRNSIGDWGTNALATELSHLQQLSRLELRLSMTGLGVEGCTALAMALGKMQELSELALSLRDNSLGGEILQPLLAAICGLPQLRILTLWLGGNELVDDSIQAMATSLARMHGLSKLELHVDSNPIEEQGKTAIDVLEANLKHCGVDVVIVS